MAESVDNWDAHWSRYAASASENPAQQMRHRIILRCLAGSASAEMRLFDIGCGQGDLLARAARRFPGAKMLGAELSARGIEIARRKLPHATLLSADLFHPPPEMERFTDWATHAVCSEVLEHVDDPRAFLNAARPYLAPDSRLIVSVPGGPMSAFDRHIGHREHFTRRRMIEVLTSAGFEPEAVRCAGFPFFNLYRFVVIARGRKVAEDVEGEQGAASALARIVMRTFGLLFHLNLPNSPFGWQIIAIARKR